VGEHALDADAGVLGSAVGPGQSATVAWVARLRPSAITKPLAVAAMRLVAALGAAFGVPRSDRKGVLLSSARRRASST
jgi:hypothetical protein